MAESDNQVVSEHFPYLPLRILVAGRAIETEALLDTGFDGAVVLPTDLLGAEMAPERLAIWQLADGSDLQAPIYPGTDGRRITVEP
jgi:predicted aspartyl protease